MIKSALVFFEHQLTFIDKLLKFVEPRHPVLIVNESLNTHIQSLKDSFPEYSISLIEKGRLKTESRRLRAKQLLFPLISKRHQRWVCSMKKELSIPILCGPKPIIEAAKSSFEKTVEKSSSSIVERSVQELRCSLSVLVDDYEELMVGGLCKSAPKADLMRAPKIIKKSPFTPATLNLKGPLWPFSPKENLWIKADDPRRPEAAYLLSETIRRRS